MYKAYVSEDSLPILHEDTIYKNIKKWKEMKLQTYFAQRI
jgi:hypothetical protein